jgi:phosphodiesterase/alkaline phosphatase D-like protein
VKVSNLKRASVRVTWMTEEAHAITLTGLSANTRYHYRVESEDEAGNLAASADLTFKTAR